jgi:hypothetical protein
MQLIELSNKPEKAELVLRPELTETKHHIVRFNYHTKHIDKIIPMNHMTKKKTIINETNSDVMSLSSSSKSVLSHENVLYWGYVLKEDKIHRFVTVKFYNEEKDDVTFFIDKIPFDHPELMWYAVPSSSPRAVDGSSNLDMNIPDLDNDFEDLKLFEMHHYDQQNDGDPVQVIDEEMEKQTTDKISHHNHEEDQEPSIITDETVNHIKMVETAHPVPSIEEHHDTNDGLKSDKFKRPSLHDAVGYTVEIKSNAPDAEPDEVYVGKVKDISTERQSIIVSFETLDDDQGDEDIEEFPYLSPDILWLQKENQTIRQDQKGAHDRPLDTDMKSNLIVNDIENESVSHSPSHSIPHSPMTKPLFQNCIPRPHRSHVIGKHIEITTEDEVIRGIVVGFQSNRNILQIQFYSDDDCLEDETDELPYLSKEIKWFD